MTRAQHTVVAVFLSLNVYLLRLEVNYEKVIYIPTVYS